jgi:hypothetical protein
MSLSKNITDDKKPIPRARLVELLTPGKKPTIKAEAPSLKNVSVTGKRVEAPKEIKPSIQSSTAVVKTIVPAEYEGVDQRKSVAMDNTIEKMATADGYAPPAKGTSLYNNYKTQIDFAKDKLVIDKDEEGRPMYGDKKSFWESLQTALTQYQTSVASGATYIDSDDETNRRFLENNRYKSTLRPGIPKFENELGAIAGGLFDPIVASTVIGLPTAAATIFGVPGAAQMGAGLMAGTVGADMVKSKYGTALEENYLLAREQGMPVNEAYEKAKTVAAKAAGVESIVQVGFAGMGAIGQAPKALLGAVQPTQRVSRILSATPKKDALKVFAKGFGENLRSAVGLGGLVGGGQAVVDNASEQEGIHVENKEERAIEGAGHMVAMDLAIKMLMHSPGAIASVSKSAKSFAKGLLASDSKLTADFVAEMEAAGQYEKGTKNVIMSEVKKYSEAAKKTPDFLGDGVKKNIATGLIEKRTKLEAEFNQLDPVFREQKQIEIDEINARLRELTTTDKPFSVETELQPKTTENATTETTGQVKEGAAEGGVSEYQGTGEGEQVQAGKQAEAPKTDIGDSTIPVTEEKGKLILSHGGDVKIEKFDESKIKGGARGELGKGFYFSEDTKYKDYGKETTSIDASSLNLIDQNAKVPSDLIERLLEWNNNLPESSFGLGKKEISKDYIDTVKRVIKEKPSYSFDDVRRTVNEKYPADREGLWSEMMVGVGIDGMKATQGDGKGGSSIRQAVIYPNPKLDSLIVKENAPSVSVADKIRSLKINPYILVGGNKNVMQMNIAGVPIRAYNIAVESIALAVEAGENIAAAVSKAIKDLKDKGYNVDEKDFKKRMMPEGEVMSKSEKSRREAELGMEGIGANDYVELQRQAQEMFAKSDSQGKVIELRDKIKNLEKSKKSLSAEDAVKVQQEIDGLNNQIEEVRSSSAKEIVGKLREAQEVKGDTKNIPDSLFEQIAKEASEPGFKPTIKEPPVKTASIVKSEYSLEKILTNPKEVFKAMYTSATTQAKFTAERLKLTADAVANAIFNEKGERVNPKAVVRAIQKFVTSKMDTETAAQEFAANINEIKRLSVNARKYGEIRGKIRDIKSASTNKKFATEATRRTTADVDFIAPSKVRDYEVDANGKMVEVDTDSAINEYAALLEDYRKSISGEIPNADKARLKLIDFVNDKRDKYEAMQVQKREAKRAAYEAKYDKLLSEGKVAVDENGKPTVSKQEYVDSLIDPKKEVSEETYDLTLEDDTDAEVMRDMTDVRQEMLKEAIDNGELDVDLVEDARLIAGIDAKKISNRNIQLFNNIIEDIVNGEAPSRMGEIVSDIEAYNNKVELLEGKTNIRDMAKYQKAGLFTNIGRAIGIERGVGAYADLGLSNLFRLVTSNAKGAAAIRKVIWAPFEKQNLAVNNMSKEFAQDLSDVFTRKSIITVENGVEKVISFVAKPLTSVNSYRIGVASTLAQFEDLIRNIQTIADATKTLSEKSYQNGKRAKDYLDNTMIALQELGIIRGFTSDENGVITNIEVNDAITMEQINSRLNDRETYAISIMKSKFKDIAPDLDNTMRQYFGTAIDMSNENYLPLSPMLFGEAPEVLVEGVIDNKIPSHVSVMRSSTTRARQNNLVNVVSKNGQNVLVNYNFDSFSTLPRKFHESANTAYTTAPVTALRKTINSKEFIEFISGKFNQKETEYIDNKRYFRSQISDVINMERQPFVLNKQMEAQRNRLSRFFMGRMLNSVDAVVKQYAPAIPLMLMHGGVEPLSISYSILAGKRLTDPRMAGMLKEFYSQTSKANRATASIDAFQQKVKSIDNNIFVRKTLNAYDMVEGVAGISLNLGDDATTMQSLLVGYIKGLKLSGKIESYAEFNLENELRNGLDPTALSHAEQFLSFINNESTSAKKGKVFRESNALYMRMLQSFSHNQNVNALIDLGILQDSFSGKTSSDDAKEAALGLGMYLANIGGYGLTVYGLGYTNYKISKKALEYSGVKLHQNEEEQKKNFNRDATRITIGNSVEAVTGRAPLPMASMFKFAAGAAYDYAKNNIAEQEKVMGKDLTGTIYDDNFSPVLMNQYGGMTGSFMQSLETIYGLGKELKTGEDIKDQYSDLIPDQKNAMYNAEMVKRWSLMLPFKSVSKYAGSVQKVIKDHKINQIDVDSDMYIRSQLAKSNMELALAKYSKEELEEAVAYVNYKEKTDKNYINYLSTTVKKYSENRLKASKIEEMSSGIFGTETSKILKNISTKNGNDVIRIMNNRYVGKDANNSEEVKFMLMNGVITPTEYAVSAAYDANGKLRVDASDEKIMAEVMKRRVDGDMLSRFSMIPKGNPIPKIDGKNIFQIYQQFSSSIYQERQKKK